MKSTNEYNENAAKAVNESTTWKKYNNVPLTNNKPDRMLLISLNEAKREFNNPSRIKKLYNDLINNNNNPPKFICMCTQQSKSKAIFVKHFQHIFGEYLEENGYRKSGKYDASFTIPGFTNNTNIRTRIYELKNKNDWRIEELSFSISEDMGKTSEATKNRQAILTNFSIHKNNTHKNNTIKKFNILNTELIKGEGERYNSKREGEFIGLVREFKLEEEYKKKRNIIICGSLYFENNLKTLIKNNTPIGNDKLKNYLQEIIIRKSLYEAKNIIEVKSIYDMFIKSIIENGRYNNCSGEEKDDSFSLGKIYNKVINFSESTVIKGKEFTEKGRERLRDDERRKIYESQSGGWNPFKSFVSKDVKEETPIVKKLENVNKLENVINLGNVNNKKMCNRILYALQDDDVRNKRSIEVYTKKIGYYKGDDENISKIHAHKLIYKYFYL
jgi:hypothetical protein